MTAITAHYDASMDCQIQADVQTGRPYQNEKPENQDSYLTVTGFLSPADRGTLWGSTLQPAALAALGSSSSKNSPEAPPSALLFRLPTCSTQEGSAQRGRHRKTHSTQEGSTQPVDTGRHTPPKKAAPNLVDTGRHTPPKKAAPNVVGTWGLWAALSGQRSKILSSCVMCVVSLSQKRDLFSFLESKASGKPGAELAVKQVHAAIFLAPWNAWSKASCKQRMQVGFVGIHPAATSRSKSDWNSCRKYQCRSYSWLLFCT